MLGPERLRFLLLLVPAALAPVACGEVAGPDPAMTEAEAAALVRGLYGGRLLAHGEILHLGPYSSFNVSKGHSPVRAAIPCAHGGRASFTGDAMLTLAEGTMSAELEGTLTARDCAFSGDDVSFLMDSDRLAQSIRITLSYDAGILIEADVSGTLTWSLDDRGGRCDLANKLESRISLDDAAAGVAPVARLTGTVCGWAMQDAITLAESP